MHASGSVHPGLDQINNFTTLHMPFVAHGAQGILKDGQLTATQQSYVTLLSRLDDRELPSPTLANAFWDQWAGPGGQSVLDDTSTVKVLLDPDANLGALIVAVKDIAGRRDIADLTPCASSPRVLRHSEIFPRNDRAISVPKNRDADCGSQRFGNVGRGSPEAPRIRIDVRRFHSGVCAIRYKNQGGRRPPQAGRHPCTSGPIRRQRGRILTAHRNQRSGNGDEVVLAK